jgi:signal transduction histidine kinase
VQEEPAGVRERQQAAVARLGLRALETGDLSALMDEAVTLLASTLDVDCCKVLELLPDGRTFLLRSGVGWTEGTVGRATVGAGTDSQAGYTLLGREPVIVEDLRTETRFSGPALLHDHGLVSGMSVVIEGRDRPFGVLGAHARRRRTFTRDDVNFLQAVANVLAVAIERARAEERLREERETAVVLSKAALDYLASGKLGDAASPLLHRAVALTGAGFGFIAAVGPDGDLRFMAVSEHVLTSMRGTALHAHTMREFELNGYFTFPRNANLVYSALDSPEGLIVNDVPGRAEAVELPEGHPRVESFMGVPLRAGGEVVGLVGLANRPGGFDEAQLRNLRPLAAMAALAISRAQAESERRALQEQLLRVQRLETVGRLAGGVAHDFNNLLTVVMANSEMMLQALPAGAADRDRVAEILEASQKAAALTRQLLAFSRRQVLEMKVLDLNEVIAGITKMLARLIGEDIRLEVVPAPNLWRTRADPAQIEQVIVNLVVNARDAMPKGGDLTIETSNVELDGGYARTHVGVAPGRYVLMAISDTGMGMPDEVKEHVFEPFFTTKGETGTGLGLSTVYGIVKQHGGNVWVYSEAGQGTTVKVYLPATEAAAEPTGEAAAVGEAPRGAETILLVEDDEAVRSTTGRALERQGYTVLAAAGATEAVRFAEGHPGEIALLITDVVMPEMRGTELAQLLLGRWPHMRVLYMSGYADNAIVHHGVLDAGVHFLQKPFSLRTLVRKVRNLLDEPAG